MITIRWYRRPPKDTDPVSVRDETFTNKHEALAAIRAKGESVSKVRRLPNEGGRAYAVELSTAKLSSSR